MNNSQNKNVKHIPCPECDTPIEIKEMSKGKIVECATCGIESEIVSTLPLKLAPLEEEK